MKSRFLTYLENFSDMATLKRSKDCVTVAMDAGNIGMLSRVFNNFPTHFLKENITYYAIDPALEKKWVEQCQQIIQPDTFEMIEENHNAKTIIHSQWDAAKKEAIDREIKHFFETVIVQACKDILDEKGNLNKDIVTFLQLQDLLDKHINDRIMLDKIIFQVLNSYFFQIAFSNIITTLSQSENCDIEQLNMFNKISYDLCSSNEAKATPFLKNTVLNYLFDDSVYSTKSCKELLKHIQPENISDILSRDMKSIEPKIKDINFLYAQQVSEKQKFWENVMKDFDSDPILSNNQKKSYMDAISESLYDPLKVLSSENNEEYQLLMPWFHTRDNMFIIDHLIQSATTLDKKNLSDIKLKLQDEKFIESNVKKPTAQFFEAIYQKLALESDTKQAKIFLDILDNIAPDLSLHLQLPTSGDITPISQAIQQNRWDHVSVMLVNMKDQTALSKNDLTAISKNRHALVDEFKKFIKRSAQNPTEKLERFDFAMSRAFGAILMEPATHNATKAFLFNFLSSSKKTTKSAEELMKFREKLEHAAGNKLILSYTSVVRI